MTTQPSETPSVGTYTWWETQLFPAMPNWTVALADEEHRKGRPMVISGDKTTRWYGDRKDTPPW